jgi:hypothetical protein
MHRLMVVAVGDHLARSGAGAPPVPRPGAGATGEISPSREKNGGLVREDG